MSHPPARIPTKGYAPIPNSLIENQAAFTRAELALALIVLRRGGVDSTTVTVSDANWQSWTGLHPRVKEYALKGLRDKCVHSEGRGNKAKYAFDRHHWETYIQQPRAVEKTRTAGRSVAAKVGARVHPACANGCALLQQDQVSHQYTPKQVTLVPAPQNAKPVAQVAAPGHSNGRGGSKDSLKHVTLVPAPQNAKPVAQVATGMEGQWPKTLDMLKKYFPIIGLVFLMKLLSAVRVVVKDFTDRDLAEAVEFAHKHKARVQKTEGLFLMTVPNAMVAIKKRQPPPPTSPAKRIEGHYGARRYLASCAEAIRSLGDGPPYEGYAHRVEDLVGRLASLDVRYPGAALEEIDVAASAIERDLASSLWAELSEERIAEIERCVQQEILPYGSRMSRPQLLDVQCQVRTAGILVACKVPRLPMFYWPEEGAV